MRKPTRRIARLIDTGAEGRLAGGLAGANLRAGAACRRRSLPGAFALRPAGLVLDRDPARVLARNYAADTALAWPLLVDATRETYRSYGMLTASFWDVWGPKTWWAYLKEPANGTALKTSEGDISRRGGDVLIDPAGTVRLHHVGAGPADRPSVESLLKLVSASAG